MEENSRTVWEARYRISSGVSGRAPSAFLVECRPSLPDGGRALDLATGEGRNALYLVREGFQVLGLDRSPTAVAHALEAARAESLPLEAEVVDLEDHTLPTAAFDVVIVTMYLQRSLFRPIMEALRPGGFLVYETFTVGQLKYREHRREFLLEPGELREAFTDMEIVTYRETDRADEQKCLASLLARKPPQSAPAAPARRG